MTVALRPQHLAPRALHARALVARSSVFRDILRAPQAAALACDVRGVA
jgi:hypothetical protein